MNEINQHSAYNIPKAICREDKQAFCPAKTRSGKIHQFRHYTTDAPV